MIETVAGSQVFNADYLFDSERMTLADLYLIPLIVEATALSIDLTQYSNLDRVLRNLYQNEEFDRVI